MIMLLKVRKTLFCIRLLNCHAELNDNGNNHAGVTPACWWITCITSGWKGTKCSPLTIRKVFTVDQKVCIKSHGGPPCCTCKCSLVKTWTPLVYLHRSVFGVFMYWPSKRISSRRTIKYLSTLLKCGVVNNIHADVFTQRAERSTGD